MTDGAYIRAPRFFSSNAAGWTLVELVIVLVVSVILVYFAVRNFSPKQGLALQQVERLRDDVRQIQILAMTWNQALRLTTVAAVAGVSPARYEVSCVVGSATPPCNATPVINPANGSSFRVTLESDLDIGATTLDFDPLGRPKSGAALVLVNTTFTISGGGVGRTVVVQPLTGFATAQ